MIVAVVVAAICGTADGRAVRLAAAATGTAVAAETGAAADAAAAAGRAQQLDAATGATAVAAAAAAIVAAAAAGAGATGAADLHDARLGGAGKHTRFLSVASADSINSSAHTLSLSFSLFSQLASCERSIKLFTICVFNTMLPAFQRCGSALLLIFGF